MKRTAKDVVDEWRNSVVNNDDGELVSRINYWAVTDFCPSFAHPELGSGALREALELHEYRNGLCTCGQFVMPHYSYGDLVKFLETHPGRDIRWRFWLDHFAAALSLSSPIEPKFRDCGN